MDDYKLKNVAGWGGGEESLGKKTDKKVYT